MREFLLSALPMERWSFVGFLVNEDGGMYQVIQNMDIYDNEEHPPPMPAFVAAPMRSK